MRKTKLLASLLSCTMAASLMLTACGGSDDSSTSSATSTTVTEASQASEVTQKADPFGKYDETLELTSCSVFATWMTIDPGEDENNNWWTKTYLDKLNIKVTQSWTAPNFGPDFDQKFNVASASDSLPDIMPCYTSLAVREIKNDKVWDMTQTYNDYASDQVKALFTKDPNAIKAWSVDGKMMGIPMNVRTDAPTRRGFWIRKDWLDKLNLPVPKTFAEVENVMKEFVTKRPGGQKGTYGIGMDKDLGLYNEILPVFGVSEARWVEKDGQLVVKNTLPEVKEVWKKLADWYKEGYISKNFPVSTADNELKQDWLNGKVGIFENTTRGMAGNSTIYDWLKANPTGDCVFVPYTKVDGSEPFYTVDAGYGNVVLVNKNCKNPEAVMKIINLTTAIFNEPKPDYIKDTQYNNGANGGWAEFFRAIGRIEDPSVDNGYTKEAYDAIKSGDESKLSFTAKNNFYNQLKAWKNEGQKNKDWTVNFTYWKAFAPGGTIEYDLKKNQEKDFDYGPYWGAETPTYSKNGQNWTAKFKEFCTQAIMTGKVDEGFNKWLDFFKANSGDEATKEANEWYQKNK